MATVGTVIGGVGAMLASWYGWRAAALDARQNSVAPLPAWVVRLAGYMLPAPQRARYLEEWRAELADLRGWRRLRHALSILVKGSWQIAYQVRLRRIGPRRGPHQYVVPLRDAPEQGWLSAAFLVEAVQGGFRYRLMCALRQDDGVRIVHLSRFSRRDSSEEITALIRQAAGLDARAKRAYRKARRSRGIEW
jgi:hypothetical protein